MSKMLRKNSRDITIHTEGQFYLPGDEIVGTVTYQPRKQVHLRFVKIIFAGEEYCIWIDKVATRVGGPVVASKAPLFRKETTLLSDRTRLEPGSHTWNFRFTIPRAVPPTCNYNNKTSVTYWLKTKAATTFGHFNARFKTPVIIGQFWVPTIPRPVHTSHSSIGGNIEMIVKSSQSVVKCDDVVVLNVQFQNSSLRNLAGLRVKLKQIWECTGVFYYKNVVMKYFTKEGFPVGRGSHNSVVELKIPHRLHLCPTVTNASLFKCTYYVGVYGLTRMAGLVATETIKCRVPLTITNQPSSSEPGDSGSSSSSSSSITRPTFPYSGSGFFDSDEDEPNRRVSASDRITASLSANAPPSRASEPAGETGVAGMSSAIAAALERAGREDAAPVGVHHVHRDTQGTFHPIHEYTGIHDLFSPAVGGPGLGSDDTVSKDKEIKGKSEAEGNEEKDGFSGECIVCYDGPKTMLLLPCAHIATCVACTKFIMYSTNKACPVCRTKISQVMRIYPV